jgi:hypothetical protein
MIEVSFTTATKLEPHEHLSMTPQTTLRPLSTADICDTAFRLYRANVRTFFGVALLLYGPLIGLKFTLAILFLEPGDWDAFLTWPLPISGFHDFSLLNLDETWKLIAISLRLLEFFIIQPIAIGALCHAAARCYLQQPVTIRAAYRLDQFRLTSLMICGGILPVIIYGLMFASLLILLSVLDSFRPGIIPVLIPLITGLGVTIIYIRLTVAVPAIVIEGSRPLSSWNRSWHLTSAASWQTLQIVVLANLLLVIMVFPPAFAVLIAGRLLFGAPHADLLEVLVGHVLWLGALVFQPIAYTLLYYTLRMRKEGYDMVLRMEPQASIYGSHWAGKNRKLLIAILLLLIVAAILLCGLLFIVPQQPSF